jgi:hypothetical protein
MMQLKWIDVVINIIRHVILFYYKESLELSEFNANIRCFLFQNYRDTR